MKTSRALDTLLKSFEAYYTINTSTAQKPFSAEATFTSRCQQYFLVKSAKLADMDSNDYVFFYSPQDKKALSSLSCEQVSRLAQIAWEKGLSKIKPYYGHRNSDITVIFLCEKIPDESFRKIKKLNLYKSYTFGLYGWSSFRALAYETSTGRFVTNRRGRDLKKIIGSLL